MPRSPSPRRDRERDRDRSRSRSPPRHHRTKQPRELSFYKKSSGPSSGVGSFSSRRDPLEEDQSTSKERAERRERGEVPARFGGTREQGVRNTMGTVGGQAGSVGSLKRTGDPLDRMGVRGDPSRDRDESRREGYGGSGGRDRERDDRRDDRRDRERDHRRDREREQPRREKEPQPPTGPAERRPPAAPPTAAPSVGSMRLIEVIANDRMGRKVRIKCLPTDTVGDLKRLIAAQTGTSAQKIQLKKWYTNFKDHIALQDYEINDGMSLEMY
ncbi:hypothetical protein CI109_101564 [Kwoniella shandongensis]|uniref:Ubiquitin-like modifier HUB1 n=1 Tax=Kwoniella shandongensis TaxID=1734106 RepID=A0AAJ8MVQ6_9TREE